MAGLHGPRTILYTGKGGVGKTSVAAATARRCAAAGARTLVLSTDPAHSLSDSLGVPVEGVPTDVGGGLWAQQVRAQEELERNWGAAQRWLTDLLADQGMGRIAAEELTVPPGGDELFSLLQLQAAHRAEDPAWDVVVVDCAPTGETLRLLSFPEVARWWLGRVVGREHQLLAAARPLARTFLSMELPDEAVFREGQKLLENLASFSDLLRAPEVTVRLVTTPDRMVVAEAMRTSTYLSLYGFHTDAVVVNRVLPADVEGTYLAGWRALQAEQLALVEDGFAPLPVLRAPWFEQEVLGAPMLDRLGEALFEGADPAAVLHEGPGRAFTQSADGTRALRLELPFVAKGDVSLKRVGNELVVRVDDHKRTIALPDALRSWSPAGAQFDGGALVVRFRAPEPARA